MLSRSVLLCLHVSQRNISCRSFVVYIRCKKNQCEDIMLLYITNLVMIGCNYIFGRIVPCIVCISPCAYFLIVRKCNKEWVLTYISLNVLVGSKMLLRNSCLLV